MNELILKIAKEMDLAKHEVEMLESDINNLRGDEWIENVFESCSPETFKEFFKVVKPQYYKALTMENMEEKLYNAIIMIFDESLTDYGSLDNPQFAEMVCESVGLTLAEYMYLMGY